MPTVSQKATLAVLMSEKVGFTVKSFTRDKEGHLL